MSFIKRNANVSLCNILKEKYLIKTLEAYNQFQLESNTAYDSLDYYIIPNNDLKYYLYTTKKSNIESCKDNYDILYFFPDEQSLKNIQNKRQINKVADFYVEIDSTFEKNYFFEGYLYKAKESEEYTYLITDILAKDNNIISCDFALRQTMINELITAQKTFNNHLTIGIHPIFHSRSENIVQMFLDNFVFQEDIKSIEHVYDKQFEKRRFSKTVNSFPDCEKRIERGSYADVYNVYDVNTGNHQGILYIKGINESKRMKQLFHGDSPIPIILNCSYNQHFKKWQPL